VKLEAVISETGEIVNLRVISGHPLLMNAALEAVAQWRYSPTLLNGTAVAVITTIEVNFRLASN
jgi:periplasmic protein TonB